MTPTSGPMAIFDQGDVIRVLFPTDRPVRQHRPALVLSRTGVDEGQRLLWVLMIISAENRRWPGDVDVGERYEDAGLPAPSLVRTAKIATIEGIRVDRIGRLPRELLEMVFTTVATTLRQ